jgi:hypothetical protein
LPRQFGQLKPNRSSGLSLPDSCPINGIAVGRHIIDAKRDEVAAAQLAVIAKSRVRFSS